MLAPWPVAGSDMSDLSAPAAAPSPSRTAAASAPPHAPLAVVMRGDAVESVHLGSVAVVDRDGRLLYAAGDPGFLTMTRSSLKPFQAMPFVAAEASSASAFSPPQVALLCASHSGEPRHVAAAADMLAKAGNARRRPAMRHAPAAASTRCAASRRRRRRIRRSRTTARASTAGCSPTASLCGLPKRDYLAYDHPLQQAIRARRRALHVDAGRRARRRDRRLLGAELCGSARPARAARSRASPRADDDAAYGRAPQVLADAMTRASGNGVGRAAAATSSSCAPDAATGWRRSAPKACRQSASAAPASASRSRSPTATGARCGPSSSRCSSSCGLLDARARASSGALVRAARCATTADSSPDGSCLVVVLDKVPLPAATSRLRRNNPAAMNLPSMPWSVDASVRRMALRVNSKAVPGCLELEAGRRTRRSAG